MLSYPYIEAVLRAVLIKSKTIGGRFYVCPKSGAELNMPSLEEIVEAMPFTGIKQKWPAAILMPPVSTADYGKSQYQDNYKMIMYFLRSYGQTNAGQVANPSPANGQSMHSTLEDWHDMKRAATNFLGVLRKVTTQGATPSALFLSDRDRPVITPVTSVGNDKVNGVALVFSILVNSDCTIEDYDPTYNTGDIILPAITDTHPVHN